MRFLNRTRELERLNRVLTRPDGGLVVLWGRRRIGKTRLLLEWVRLHDGLYTVADRSAEPVQRRYLAESVAQRFPGFGDVTYPDWRTLLRALSTAIGHTSWRGPLVLDEFAYLAAECPSLPSVLQSWLDHEARGIGLVVALAGSAQQMMEGLVLDASAPLYGRAVEALRIAPIPAPHVAEALRLSLDRKVVKAHAAWGGVPRYWELAEPFGPDLDAAVDALVLDPMGPLHSEPDRVLDAEVPSAASLRPVLDVIGSGVHRVAEIAGRLGQPAPSLARPLARLVHLGLVRRDQPFGESERGGKRSLYRIADPFLRLWFRVVGPHRSLLAAAPRARRLDLWRTAAPALFAEAWEELCRQAVPRLDVAPGGWLPAARMWSARGPEWDIVSTTADRKTTLLGEAKWHDAPMTGTRTLEATRVLMAKGVPEALRGLHVAHAVFIPEVDADTKAASPCPVVDAGDVLAALGDDGDS